MTSIVHWPQDGVRGWTGEARLVLVREFVQCQLMVQQLGELEESYVRSAVEVSGGVYPVHVGITVRVTLHGVG